MRRDLIDGALAVQREAWRRFGQPTVGTDLWPDLINALRVMTNEERSEWYRLLFGGGPPEPAEAP